MQTACYTEIRAPRWGREEREVQIVKPKMDWVFGTNKSNALIHRVHHVRLRWWTYGPGGAYLVRLQSPRMMAVCNCGQYFPLDRERGKMCALPKPEAVICKACVGAGRNFPRGQKHEIPLGEAKVRLGCVELPG